MMLDLQDQGCHNINFVSTSHVVPQILAGLLIAAEAGKICRRQRLGNPGRGIHGNHPPSAAMQVFGEGVVGEDYLRCLELMPAG